MSLTSPDFESGAYTNFATPAVREDNKASSFVAQPHPPHSLGRKPDQRRTILLFLKPCLTLMSCD